MTLTDFVNMIHTDNADLVVYVFSDEAERDEYRSGADLSGLLFMASSQYVMRFYLHERFANAEVRFCRLVNANTIDVIIKEVGKNA